MIMNYDYYSSNGCFPAKLHETRTLCHSVRNSLRRIREERPQYTTQFCVCLFGKTAINYLDVFQQDYMKHIMDILRSMSLHMIVRRVALGHTAG